VAGTRPPAEVLAERKAGLGRTTTNVAEYEGLMPAWPPRRALGASSVDVRMDSKLVVEQMSGVARSASTLQTLASRAAELAADLGR